MSIYTVTTNRGTWNVTGANRKLAKQKAYELVKTVKFLQGSIIKSISWFAR